MVLNNCNFNGHDHNAANLNRLALMISLGDLFLLWFCIRKHRCFFLHNTRPNETSHQFANAFGNVFSLKHFFSIFVSFPFHNSSWSVTSRAFALMRKQWNRMLVRKTQSNVVQYEYSVSFSCWILFQYR